MSIKQQLIAMIEQLPDDCTLEDVQYHLYVQQKVERGLKAVEEGRVVSQEEARGRFSRWLSTAAQTGCDHQ